MIILPNGKSVHEAYRRMIDSVDELVDSADEYVAEQLSMAKVRVPDLHQHSAHAYGCGLL